MFKVKAHPAERTTRHDVDWAYTNTNKVDTEYPHEAREMLLGEANAGTTILDRVISEDDNRATENELRRRGLARVCRKADEEEWVAADR